MRKKSDSMYFPDYYGIEIKCTSRFSKYQLYLFTIAFDGPNFPEINRIVEKYGWYYKIDIYKLISFDKFIELFKNDNIEVSLIVRINKSGLDAGRYRNKKLVFSIKKKN